MLILLKKNYLLLWVLRVVMVPIVLILYAAGLILQLLFGLCTAVGTLLSGLGGIAAVLALLDHCYWIAGSVIGSLAGAALGFDTTGVDFAMTALFLVIAVGQWKAAGSHLPALLGAAATLVSLLVVGAEDMLLPALGIIVLVLTLLRPRLDESRPAQQARSQEVTP